IGTLELGSPHPGDLNATHLPKLHEVLPLFSMAVQRSMEELNNRIQALIKEKCTAIHPVVEWRFRRAVLKSIEHHAAGAEASGQELEPIVFERVYPLYALSDIRGSSIERSLALDPRFGTVYARRRLFEESVTRIADTISSYLDLEEQTAQGMFPHYFEKQKTDGVDYQIYVGASLVEDGRFDPLYLKSLRLWQLMVTCGIALRTHQLRDQLPVPLEATHLVLVQHAPLSIRFRFDEKRFDVD